MIPGRELTIDSTLKTLVRRRWLFIVPLFLGVMGGLLYSRSQPSLYRSDAVIQVVPQRVPESYVSSTVTERVEDRLRALAQQVLSRTQLEKLITDFNLFPDERQKYPMEDVLRFMTERVLIEPLVATQASQRNSQSDAFRVSFDYQDPIVAQKVVEQLASFFINTNARDRGTQADQTSQFLEAQLADARGRLEAQDQKLKTFRERNSGRLPTQMQTNMQAIQNTQLALQAMVESLARDRDRKLMLEGLYADAVAATQAGAAAQASSTPGAPPAGDLALKLPADATPQQRLEAAQSLLAQMELRLSAKHPDVIRMKHYIEDLQRQADADALQRPLSPEAAQDRGLSPDEARRREALRQKKAEIESLDRQIAFKEGEERRLRKVMGDYQARLEAVPGVESEWVSLTRDYDTLQASYRELLAKSENSKMAASLEKRAIGEQFRLLDPARVPLKAQSPNRLKINGIATAAGLGFGLLLVGLVTYRDSTMRSEADVLGAIQLPILALVPFVTTEADTRRRHWRRVLVSVAVVAVAVATGALVWFLQLWKFVV